MINKREWLWELVNGEELRRCQNAKWHIRPSFQTLSPTLCGKLLIEFFSHLLHCKFRYHRSLQSLNFILHWTPFRLKTCIYLVNVKSPQEVFRIFELFKVSFNWWRNSTGPVDKAFNDDDDFRASWSDNCHLDIFIS